VLKAGNLENRLSDQIAGLSDWRRTRESAATGRANPVNPSQM